MYLHVFIEFEFVDTFSFSLFFYSHRTHVWYIYIQLICMVNVVYMDPMGFIDVWLNLFPKKIVSQTSNQGPGLFYGNICSLAESFLRGKIEVVTNMAGKWVNEWRCMQHQMGWHDRFGHPFKKPPGSLHFKVVVSKMFGMFIPKIGKNDPIWREYFCRLVETTN